VLVAPLGRHFLSGIVHSGKSSTATESDAALGQRGAFWQKESFDHIVRSAASLEKVRRYIRDNPKNIVAKSRRGFQPRFLLDKSGLEAASTDERKNAISSRHHRNLHGVTPGSARADQVASRATAIPTNDHPRARSRHSIRRHAGKNSTPYSPTGRHDFMHNKILVVDNTVITGSYNFSRSAQFNAENILIIESAALAETYSVYIDHLIQKYARAT
jgi:hypothetical protein